MPDTGPGTRPAGRYGDSPAHGRRIAVLLGAGVALLMVIWATWVAVGIAHQPVRWSQEIPNPQPDGSVEVTFQVTMKPGRTAVCTVEALDEGFGQVGLIDITVGPSERDTITVTARVPTSQQGVSGNVKDCVAS